jgi:hypothetical protein
MRSKKAQSQYISWIIIFGMVVGLSFLLYNWTIERAKQAQENLEKTTDPLVCSAIGITIDSACQSFRTVELNITNVNEMQISGFLLRNVGLYPDEADYVYSKMVNAELDTGDSFTLSVLKKSTLSQVQIIPFVKKNSKNVYCEDKAIVKEQKDLIYCE